MVENPAVDAETTGKDFRELLNKESLKVKECYVEPYLKDFKPLDYLQFQRIGYFTLDKDSIPERMIFNRTVGLKDSWTKTENR